MDWNQERKQKTVHGVWDHMKFNPCDDLKTLEGICRKSGSERVKKSAAFLRTAKWYSQGKGTFFAETVDDIAFYAGTFCRSHFNLVEFAVVKEHQLKGIGGAMANRMKQKCRMRGVNSIRLRTAIGETAVDFWQKQGAKIVGCKDDDFIMEIDV